MKRIALLGLMLLALASLAVACGGGDNAASPAATTATGKSEATATSTIDPNVFTNPQLLAETSWLSGKLEDKSIVAVDLRKKEAFDAGHIPGAVWYDSNSLKDPDQKLFVIRDTLFAQNLGAIGIDNTKTVVAYDDNAGLSSVRFWWVLSYYGDNNARVLNGGFPKWQKENLPVAKDSPVVTKVTFTPAINDKVISSLDTLKQQATSPSPNVVILDVRTAAEYTGADVRSAKGGHVPTAINLDWTRTMSDSDPKVWKSAAELRKLVEQAGVKPGSQVITYCQSGVRAAQLFFTLRLLGFDNVRNYDGSWAEWGNSTSTPIER